MLTIALQVERDLANEELGSLEILRMLAVGFLIRAKSLPMKI